MSDQNNEQTDRFHEGKEHSHQANDSKDSRTIANKLAREEQVRSHNLSLVAWHC